MRRKNEILQGALILGALLVFFLGFQNANTHLENQGIQGGLGFLDKRAGFSIIQTLIPYTEDSSYGRAFWVALLNTGLVSVLGIFFATILGVTIGIGRTSSHWLIRGISGFYTDVIRNVPLLLQLFVWYFVALRALPGPRESFMLWDMVFLNNRGLYIPKPLEPIWIGTFVLSLGLLKLGLLGFFLQSHPDSQKKSLLFAGCSLGLCVLSLALTSYEIPVLEGFNFSKGMELIPELVALVCALSVYTAAFIGEIIRSGIGGIQKGQWEASLSLGLSKQQALWLVIMPQALRILIPPLTSQYLNLAKNSSLAAAIAYPDLVSVFAGTVLNQTGQALPVIGITMGVYLSMSLTISFFMNWFHRRFALIGTGGIG
jgi:general L-amino acid transport system permease protein